MNEERIELTDSTTDVMIKMSEGNPGALNALIDILKNGASVDMDSAMGGLGAILMLDSMGIYGTDIYILYSDICGKSLPKTLAVLRACQLGLFSRNAVKDAAHRQDRSGKAMIPVDELYTKVKEQLPLFDSDAVEVEK